MCITEDNLFPCSIFFVLKPPQDQFPTTEITDWMIFDWLAISQSSSDIEMVVLQAISFYIQNIKFKILNKELYAKNRYQLTVVECN